jgi:hypothetical protein
MLFFSSYGVGQLISMLVKEEDSNLVSTVVGLAFASFNGYGPTLVESRDIWPLNFILSVSYNRYATEAVYSMVLSLYSEIYKVQNSADHYGYTLDRVGYDVYMMFYIGIAFRILAYFFMIIVNRDKQGGKSFSFLG